MNSNISKPIIGILASPYISNKSTNNKIFLTNFIIRFLKKNHITHIVIPYNLSKHKLKNIIKDIDGLIFPGSQYGNYYHTKEFKRHFKSQKYLISMAKKANANKGLPVLSICHGYENLMLIEAGLSPLKKKCFRIFYKC